MWHSSSILPDKKIRHIEVVWKHSETLKLPWCSPWCSNRENQGQAQAQEAALRHFRRLDDQPNDNFLVSQHQVETGRNHQTFSGWSSRLGPMNWTSSRCGFAAYRSKTAASFWCTSGNPSSRQHSGAPWSGIGRGGLQKDKPLRVPCSRECAWPVRPDGRTRNSESWASACCNSSGPEGLVVIVPHIDVWGFCF